jgi:hypothetical protein
MEPSQLECSAAVSISNAIIASPAPPRFLPWSPRTPSVLTSSGRSHQNTPLLLRCRPPASAAHDISLAFNNLEFEYHCMPLACTPERTHSKNFRGVLLELDHSRLSTASWASAICLVPLTISPAFQHIHIITQASSRRARLPSCPSSPLSISDTPALSPHLYALYSVFPSLIVREYRHAEPTAVKTQPPFAKSYLEDRNHNMLMDGANLVMMRMN